MTLNPLKILLLHPLGYKAEAAGHDIARTANIMPPLGLASIAAYLDRAGYESIILDCYAEPRAEQKFLDLLRGERPALLGISCTTASFHDSVRMAEIARNELPEIRIAFGGAHVSALKEQILEFSPVIDYAVIGEGEQTMLELAELGTDEPREIGGVVWRDASGELVNNGYRKDRLVLDDLPFPAYEKLPGYPDSYKLPIFNYPTAPNSSCISSRGCPYKCSYCDRSVFQSSFRYNSAEYLYNHLKYLKERFGIRHINFYDDQFTFHRGRVEQLCRMLIDKPLGMTYNCAVRAEHIDLELIKLMKAAGCWMVSLGIESGDEQLLAQHRQNVNLDFMAETIRMIKSCGIRVKGLLMMGLPGESEASIRRSMDYVYGLKLDDFNLTKFTPFPGSPIYQNIHEVGTFDEDWPKLDCMHFQFVPHGMEKEQLEKLFIEFYRNHFKQSRVIWSYITMLWKSPDSWKRFIAGAGEFARFILSNKRYGGN